MSYPQQSHVLTPAVTCLTPSSHMSYPQQSHVLTPAVTCLTPSSHMSYPQRSHVLTPAVTCLNPQQSHVLPPAVTQSHILCSHTVLPVSSMMDRMRWPPIPISFILFATGTSMVAVHTGNSGATIRITICTSHVPYAGPFSLMLALGTGWHFAMCSSTSQRASV